MQDFHENTIHVVIVSNGAHGGCGPACARRIDRGSCRMAPPIHFTVTARQRALRDPVGGRLRASRAPSVSGLDNACRNADILNFGPCQSVIWALSVVCSMTHRGDSNEKWSIRQPASYG